MARGQERCVYLLPRQEFRRIAMRIQRVSMSDRKARDYLRVFLSGAVDQEPDRQGRILVPQMLRDYADLGTEVAVIGVGTRAEIWNRTAWEEYLASQEQGYADSLVRLVVTIMDFFRLYRSVMMLFTLDSTHGADTSSLPKSSITSKLVFLNLFS